MNVGKYNIHGSYGIVKENYKVEYRWKVQSLLIEHEVWGLGTSIFYHG